MLRMASLLIFFFIPMIISIYVSYLGMRRFHQKSLKNWLRIHLYF